MPKLIVRIFFVLVVLIMLRGTYTEMRTWLSFEGDSDFPVYYTAAWLIREHRDLHIYDPARLDINPAYGDADPDSVFYQTALRHGIQDVRRYIYPPTLADLMVPLTVLSPVTALILWDLLNLAAFVSASIMLARMAGIHTIGQTCLLVVALLLFRPTLNASTTDKPPSFSSFCS